MQDQKHTAQRKIRQLAFLHAGHVLKNGGKIQGNQAEEYNRLYAEWQAGSITLSDIEDDTAEYLKLRDGFK